MVRVFWSNFKRAFCSSGFIIAVIGTIIASLLGGINFIINAYNRGALEYAGEVSIQSAYTSMYSNVFLLLLPILCTLPYSGSFIEDYHTKLLRYYLPRSGRQKYLINKTFIIAFSGGSALFLGQVIVLLVCTLLFPPIGIEADIERFNITYGVFFSGAFLILLGGFLWALFGGILATAFKNQYMAYSFPFIIYYVASSFQHRYFKLYYAFNPQEWIRPGHIEFDSALTYAIAAIIIASLLLYYLMKRNLKDV